MGASVAIYAVIYELGQEGLPQADHIYIFARLSHHLVPDWDLNRWVWKYLIFNAFLIWGYRKKDESWKKFIFLALISNIFWITGLIVYHLGHHNLLKYYFFRVPDTLIPFTSYLVITSILFEKIPMKFKEHKALLPIVCIIFTFEFSSHFLKFYKKQNTYSAREIYSWIKQNISPDSVILANPSSANFYAFTDRSIYVSHKHLPQIKQYLIEYQRRLELVLGKEISSKPLDRLEIEETYEKGLPNLSREDLKREGITHVLSPIELDFTLLKSTESFYLYQVE